MALQSDARRARIAHGRPTRAQRDAERRRREARGQLAEANARADKAIAASLSGSKRWRPSAPSSRGGNGFSEGPDEAGQNLAVNHFVEYEALTLGVKAAFESIDI